MEPVQLVIARLPSGCCPPCRRPHQEEHPKYFGWPHSVMHWQLRGVKAADLAAGLYAQRFAVNSAAVAKRLLQQQDELHGLLCGLPALKVGGCHGRGHNNEAQRAFLGPFMREMIAVQVDRAY